MTVLATACRLCAVGCGTLVEVEPGLDGASDRVLKVTGDPDDTTTHGYTCSKGRSAPAFHDAPERLNAPFVRRSGSLVSVGWDAALDDIADRTRALIDEYGPGVIANYVGTGGPIDPAGYAMAHGFFRALGCDQSYSALSVDCSAKALLPQLVGGVQLMFQPDLDHASLLLAFGVNTVVSHGHGVMISNPIVALRSLRERGGKVVVIDPRVSETAHHADLHVQLRPGTDPALLACLVRSVLLKGSDTTYLDACADAASVEMLRVAVEPFDVAHTSRICGVDSGVVDDLIALVLASGRVAIETGTGTTLNASSTLTEWLVWALGAVTGSLDRVGGCTFNAGFLRRFEDGVPSGRGDLGLRPQSRPDLPRIVNGEMPSAALVDEIEAGHVKALFVRVGNPVLAFPDTERVRAALSSLELLVAIDVRHNETTDIATHVLPMTDHFERSDLLTGYLQAKPFMRAAPAVVRPIGERRQQWWMFAELSRRLAVPLFGSPRKDRALAGVTLDDDVIAASMLDHARHTWDDVRNAPYGIVDDSVAPGWLIPDRLGQRLDLAPAGLGTGLRAFTGAPEKGLGESRADLVLTNRRTATAYNSLAASAGLAALEMHPIDADSRSLHDGDEVVISTHTGSCAAALLVTDRIRPGVVSLPHGHAGSNVNLLTSSVGADPHSAMPVLSGFRVTVKRALADRLSLARE